MYYFLMKYSFTRKDGQVIPDSLALLPVFFRLDSEYKQAGLLGGVPDLNRGSDTYVEVEVHDTVTIEQMIPIMDKLGYKPLERNPAPSS